MQTVSILLVEDDLALSSLVKDSLEERGYIVHTAYNGVDGCTLFKRIHPDVCIIDIKMPRKDGFSLVEDIRLVNDQVSILFLSGMTGTQDVIRGLTLGADDYVKKPFSMEELILRINILVRRRAERPADSLGSTIRIGIFHFQYNARQLLHGSVSIALSQREADLLLLLFQHENEVVDRKTALLRLWGQENWAATRSMDVYITRLRKIFKPDPTISIVNHRGKGYMLTVNRS
jgi:two-component system, OmpR family, response regulator TrcR